VELVLCPLSFQSHAKTFCYRIAVTAILTTHAAFQTEGCQERLPLMVCLLTAQLRINLNVFLKIARHTAINRVIGTMSWVIRLSLLLVTASVPSELAGSLPEHLTVLIGRGASPSFFIQP